MKKWMLFLLVVFTASITQAQSLKDMLYSGKLKKDSNVVIRKGEDLSSKIDTASRKPETEVVKAAPVQVDPEKKNTNADTAIVVAEGNAETPVIPVVNASVVSKNNNQVLKEFVDSLVTTLKAEVLSSKKIKKETYYLYIDYEIEPTGQVNILNVVSNPENDYLQDQVKQRLLLGFPVLQPAVDSNNKPRKVKRKYNFTVTKD